MEKRGNIDNFYGKYGQERVISAHYPENGCLNNQFDVSVRESEPIGSDHVNSTPFLRLICVLGLFKDHSLSF